MTLLQLRRERKRHQPYFVVKESLPRGSRIGRRWRANRGIHSGIRQYHKGKPALPTSGYGSPREVRGLHPSGQRGVLVHTAAELLNLREGEGAIVSATIGNRTKLQLLSLVVEKKISLLNVRDPAAALEKIKAALVQRTASRREWLKNKGLKQEERQKKVEEKKKKEKKEEKKEGKKKAEEELAKQKALEEAKKKEQEELAKKKAEEDLAKKLAEEAAKKKAEEELAKKKAEAELAKKKVEEEAKRKIASKKTYLVSIERPRSGKIVSRDGKINCGISQCYAEYKEGATVTLKAVPDGEHEIEEWSGDCEGSNLQCTLVINEDKKIGVVFTERERSWDRSKDKVEGGTTRDEPEEPREPAAQKICDPNVPMMYQRGCVEGGQAGQKGEKQGGPQKCDPNAPSYSQKDCIP